MWCVCYIRRFKWQLNSAAYIGFYLWRHGFLLKMNRQNSILSLQTYKNMIRNVVHPSHIQHINQSHAPMPPQAAAAAHHHMGHPSQQHQQAPPPRLNMASAPAPQLSYAPNQPHLNVQQKQKQLQQPQSVPQPGPNQSQQPPQGQMPQASHLMHNQNYHQNR